MTPNLQISDAVQLVTELMVASIAAAPLAFALGRVAEARKRVADRFGKSFADKSSKELLRRLAAPVREAFASHAPESLPLVLEFSAARGLIGGTRQSVIAQLRDEFLSLTSPVRLAIEKVAGVGTVQVCWLNATIRTAAQPNIVAEIAGHDDLQVLRPSETSDSGDGPGRGHGRMFPRSGNG